MTINTDSRPKRTKINNIYLALTVYEYIYIYSEKRPTFSERLKHIYQMDHKGNKDSWVE